MINLDSIPLTRQHVASFEGETVRADVHHEPANYMGLGGAEKWTVRVEDATCEPLSDQWAQTFRAYTFLAESEALTFAQTASDADVSDLA